MNATTGTFFQRIAGAYGNDRLSYNSSAVFTAWALPLAGVCMVVNIQQRHGFPAQSAGRAPVVLAAFISPEAVAGKRLSADGRSDSRTAGYQLGIGTVWYWSFGSLRFGGTL